MPQIYSFEKEFYKKGETIEMSKYEILLIVGLLFLIIAMPITYIYVHKFTRYIPYVPAVVDVRNCPTLFGVLLHAVVMVLLVYLALQVPAWYS